MRRKSLYLRSLFCLAFLAAVPTSGAEEGKADDTMNEYGASSNWWSTIGLPQTFSAESMEHGLFNFSLRGAWHQPNQTQPNAPVKGANVATVLGSAAYGLNQAVDLFVSGSVYGTNDWNTNDASGFGSVMGGLQGSLPFLEKSPIRLAAQFAGIAGTATRQLNENGLDGWHYFETRDNFDFMLRLMQTHVVSSSTMTFKLHLNEALVTSLEENKDAIFLFGAGLEFAPHRSVVFGLEGQMRTFVEAIEPQTDPFWISPSLTIRTPFNTHFHMGGNFSLSQERENSTVRALEPWQAYAGLTFNFDTRADLKKREREKARQDSLAKVELSTKAEMAQKQADSLAMAAKAEQVRLAQEREMAQKQLDSLAEKRSQDSLALLETQMELKKEKSKRSEAELELLRTGVLSLDAVYFESGRATLTINSKPYLKTIGRMLENYPKLELEIQGHTDNVGSDATNMALSQARAEAVRSFLIDTYSALNGRLTARGYGETRPKADNRTAEGRQINRRVEIQVLNKEALKEYLN